MKAEHLRVGDDVIVPWLPGIRTITAILPPLIYQRHLVFHVTEATNPIYVPADRELTIFGATPVLS